MGSLFPFWQRRALSEASINPTDLDAVAYTRGPGLAACLRVCSNAGRTLAATLNIPSIGESC